MMADGSLVSVNQAMGDMKVRGSTHSVRACVLYVVCGVSALFWFSAAVYMQRCAALSQHSCYQYTRGWYTLYGTRHVSDQVPG
jgi:hypothetical protein